MDQFQRDVQTFLSNQENSIMMCKLLSAASTLPQFQSFSQLQYSTQGFTNAPEFVVSVEGSGLYDQLQREYVQTLVSSEETQVKIITREVVTEELDFEALRGECTNLRMQLNQSSAYHQTEVQHLQRQVYVLTQQKEDLENQNTSLLSKHEAEMLLLVSENAKYKAKINKLIIKYRALKVEFGGALSERNMAILGLEAEVKTLRGRIAQLEEQNEQEVKRLCKIIAKLNTEISVIIRIIVNIQGRGSFSKELWNILKRIVELMGQIQSFFGSVFAKMGEMEDTFWEKIRDLVQKISALTARNTSLREQLELARVLPTLEKERFLLRVRNLEDENGRLNKEKEDIALGFLDELDNSAQDVVKLQLANEQLKDDLDEEKGRNRRRIENLEGIVRNLILEKNLVQADLVDERIGRFLADGNNEALNNELLDKNSLLSRSLDSAWDEGGRQFITLQKQNNNLQISNRHLQDEIFILNLLLKRSPQNIVDQLVSIIVNIGYKNFQEIEELERLRVENYLLRSNLEFYASTLAQFYRQFTERAAGYLAEIQRLQNENIDFRIKMNSLERNNEVQRLQDLSQLQYHQDANNYLQKQAKGLEDFALGLLARFINNIQVLLQDKVALQLKVLMSQAKYKSEVPPLSDRVAYLVQKVADLQRRVANQPNADLLDLYRNRMKFLFEMSPDLLEYIRHIRAMHLLEVWFWMSQNSSLQSALTRSQNQLQRVHQFYLLDMITLLREIEFRDRKIKELEEQLANAKTLIDKLLAKLKRVSSDLEYAQRRIVDLKRDYFDRIAALLKERANLLDTISWLSTKLRNLESFYYPEVRSLVQDKEQLLVQVETLKSLLLKLQGRSQRLYEILQILFGTLKGGLNNIKTKFETLPTVIEGGFVPVASILTELLKLLNASPVGESRSMAELPGLGDLRPKVEALSLENVVLKKKLITIQEEHYSALKSFALENSQLKDDLENSHAATLEHQVIRTPKATFTFSVGDAQFVNAHPADGVNITFDELKYHCHYESRQIHVKFLGSLPAVSFIVAIIFVVKGLETTFEVRCALTLTPEEPVWSHYIEDHVLGNLPECYCYVYFFRP